jgi:hypothetical protein
MIVIFGMNLVMQAFRPHDIWWDFGIRIWASLLCLIPEMMFRVFGYGGFGFRISEQNTTGHKHEPRVSHYRAWEPCAGGTRRHNAPENGPVLGIARGIQRHASNTQCVVTAGSAGARLPGPTMGNSRFVFVCCTSVYARAGDDALSQRRRQLDNRLVIAHDESHPLTYSLFTDIGFTSSI